MTSWWGTYEQLAIVLAFAVALVTVAVGFIGSKKNFRDPFVVTLTWDFSRSWATNITGLAGVIGVTVVSTITTDFKPFSQPSVKSSYAAASILMAAVVVAAPSIYTLLQERSGNQLVGCVGGFVAASLLTIWGTIAQLLLQGALLIVFVREKPDSRLALLLVPLVLAIGLILLFPYSVKSIQAAIALETQPPSSPLKAGVEELEDEARRSQGISESVEPPRRKIALL